MIWHSKGMGHQRGSWFAHGLSKSRPFRRDEKQVVNLILFMVFVAGFVFLISALLLLGFGPNDAFYCFMGIFLIIESIFISVTCYLRYCERSSASLSNEDESSIKAGKNEASKLCTDSYGSTSFLKGSITHVKVEASIEEG